MKKISAAQVRTDFSELPAVIHYTRAAHELGLWESERRLIQRFFPDREAPLLEAGCGAGRVTLGLWSLGYHRLTAFDFAPELLDQAISLATERNATAIRFLHADATRLPREVCHLMDDKPNPGSATGPAATCHPMDDKRRVFRAGGATSGRADVCHPLDQRGRRPPGGGRRHRRYRGFGGALFMFNGLMQIPGRTNRRGALRELHRVCAPGAPLLFTTHDRNHSPAEQALWRLETLRWVRGEQDPRLVEFGDRYFEDEARRTFMHVPDRAEILADLAATGWRREFDEMRASVAKETRAVREFSDECRFWLARK